MSAYIRSAPIQNTTEYLSVLPARKLFPIETVLVFDSILSRYPAFARWSQSFRYRVPLKSGEKLKTLDSLNATLKKLNQMQIPQSTELTFVAVGGGSVGDFVGFLASTYLRGRRLIQIPSTWLSAVDSAHGGKNGLNFLNTKNQIGTFYPAQKIYLCESLLKTQPQARLTEAMGEVIKIALLSDKKLFEEIENQHGVLSSTQLFKKLPEVVGLKYKIVQQDPLEKKGHRRLLNLGHTLGHVFESHFQWPHGLAVLMGMQFAARWSRHRGLLSEKDFFRIALVIESLNLQMDLDQALSKIPDQKIKALLSKDKKLTSASEMDFIFIQKIGRCLRQKVKLSDILQEVKRQRAVADVSL
ncbi:3-dehydroquinate synthase [Pseudobdellovibrio exovorus]|uniref:3-dehydroquinate synthetase n=1 Tax=Pseudobdellovibrio exovorus JSS TaxID=1184267 RepID=M4V8B7_9BACT|nr:3-dehydroquinate synthase family protein [Pseudobdellovibrio exovorus]AGH94695.1 3-dehydroquinate synthetase [Pseudobdellovibrio exovorus JSS]